MRRYKLYKISLTVSRALETILRYWFIYLGVLIVLQAVGGWVLSLFIIMITLYLSTIGGIIGVPLAVYGYIYGKRHSPGGLNTRDAKSFVLVAILYSVPLVFWINIQINNSHVVDKVRYSINGGPSKEQLAKVKLGTLKQVEVLLKNCNVHSVELDRYDSWGPKEPKNLYVSIAMRNHFGYDDPDPAPSGINLPYADYEPLKVAIKQKNADLMSGDYPSCWQEIKLPS